jgi:hypothetical protein
MKVRLKKPEGTRKMTWKWNNRTQSLIDIKRAALIENKERSSATAAGKSLRLRDHDDDGQPWCLSWPRQWLTISTSPAGLDGSEDLLMLYTFVNLVNNTLGC